MSPFLVLGVSAFSWLGGSLLSFALVFVLALVWRRVLPERFTAARGRFVAQPAHSMVRGFFLAGGAIAVMAVLFISVVGIPFALALGCALSIASYFGLTVGCSVLGAALPLESLKGNETKQIAAGTAAAFLLVQVPFLGPVLAATLAMVGIGALGNAAARRSEHPYRDAPPADASFVAR